MSKQRNSAKRKPSHHHGRTTMKKRKIPMSVLALKLRPKRAIPIDPVVRRLVKEIAN